MSWPLKLTAAVAMSLALISSDAHAGLNVVGRFKSPDSEIDVANYSETDSKGVEQRIGLLGIAIASKRNSVAFSPKEWGALITLWRQAKAAQGPTWRNIGDFTETGTSDTSHLTVSAGPGVRFIIESPARGAISADLANSDITRFDAALSQATQFLVAP